MYSVAIHYKEQKTCSLCLPRHNSHTLQYGIGRRIEYANRVIFFEFFCCHVQFLAQIEVRICIIAQGYIIVATNLAFMLYLYVRYVVYCRT